MKREHIQAPSPHLISGERINIIQVLFESERHSNKSIA
jgi:hypothetical protein